MESAKECVTTHLTKLPALKMEAAKACNLYAVLVVIVVKENETTKSREAWR